MLTLVLAVLLLLLPSLGHARWVTRYVWRSDFFCSTAFESYESSEEGACWAYNGSEWRSSRVADDGTLFLDRFGDANCSGVPLEPAWSAPPLSCTPFGPAGDNTFFGAAVADERPSGSEVLEELQFGSGNCSGLPVRVTGTSPCVQDERGGTLAWTRTDCYATFFVQHSCVVADCTSGCSVLLEQTTLARCSAAAAANESLWWGTCNITAKKDTTGTGSAGLPGILPPLNGGAATGVLWGLALLVAAFAMN